ncbi:UNVERIFIED_ORG: hypothetical protein FHR35_004513 [Microbispora rosea subsp. rosea]
MGELPAVMLGPALVELEDLPVALAVPQVSFGDVPQALAFPYDVDLRVPRLRLLGVRRHPDEPAGANPAVGGEGGSVGHLPAFVQLHNLLVLHGVAQMRFGDLPQGVVRLDPIRRVPNSLRGNALLRNLRSVHGGGGDGDRGGDCLGSRGDSRDRDRGDQMRGEPLERRPEHGTFMHVPQTAHHLGEHRPGEHQPAQPCRGQQRVHEESRIARHGQLRPRGKVRRIEEAEQDDGRPDDQRHQSQRRVNGGSGRALAVHLLSLLNSLQHPGGGTRGGRHAAHADE